jgi:nucleoid DNA-binding protein
MNTKINLPQLAKILAQKTNVTQKDAEVFLKEFFDSIVQNVTTDKLVKIKGLGTFKLIEVLDRESVNVNTGERIVIPGHSKLSFIPEAALKDLINKPFADFQTTILNEGTSIEEMEWVPQEDSSPEVPAEEEKEEMAAALFSVPETNVAPEPEPAPEPVQPVEPKVEEKPIAEEAPAQKLVEEPVETPEPEAKMEETPAQKLVDEPVEAPKPEAKVEKTPAPKPESDEKKPKGSLGKILAWILGILLLCLLAFFAYKYLSGKPSAKANAESEQKVEAPADSLAEAPVEEVEYAQVPGGKYKIVGTRKTYVMKRGDFLTRIAIQEYGDKDVAQYIIVHNDFPDPDNVPVDAEIKLPELEPIE